MYLPNSKGQQIRAYLLDASGTITTGGAPQLLLPESKSRCMFIFANLSSGPLYLEFGGARATAAISNGAVTGFTVTNAGFGYTFPPTVTLMGGGPGVGPASRAAGQPDYPAPGDSMGFTFRTGDLSQFRPAKAHAVLSAGAVSSIAIDDPGAGYQAAPYVLLDNQLELDVYGCAVPSASSGIEIPNGTAPFILNGTACPTDPIAVFGATGGQAFACKWMI